jgi:hypothetical protein
MDTQPKRAPTPAPAQTASERLWRNTFFVLSALLSGLALFRFDTGQFAHGLGDLGASVLMVSLMSQFPFVRAVFWASSEGDGSPENLRRRQEELMKQAAQLKAAHPWADLAGRAGWALLGISLILRITGAA